VNVWWRAATRAGPAARATSATSCWPATERNLQKIQARVVAGKLTGAAAIGVARARSSDQPITKVAKHFDLEIGATRLHFARNPRASPPRRPWTGIYLIRTSMVQHPDHRLDCPDMAVSHYKALANASGRSRSLKTIDSEGGPRSPSPGPIGCAPTSS